MNGDEPAYAIAYQGAPGAFGEEAALVWAPPEGALLPCVTFADVVVAVAGGRARRGVLPLHNTIAGPVYAARAAFVAGPVRLIGSLTLPVRQALIGPPGATLRGVRVAASHPMALAQCGRFLRAHDLRGERAFDTAGAVRDAVRARRPERAAIAGRRAAERWGGVVLADGIEDRPGNATRFVLFEAGPLHDVAAPSPAVRSGRGRPGNRRQPRA